MEALARLRGSGAAFIQRRYYSLGPFSRGDPSASPPKQPIIMHKQDILKSSFYEPRDFAKHICNPMMKLPSDNMRLLDHDAPHIYKPTEKGKTVCNSFRQILFDLHRRKLSFADPMKITNFFITESYHEYALLDSNLLVDCNYKFLLKEGIPLCTSSRKSINEDYIYGARVLQQFFEYTCDLSIGRYAEDVLDFFDSMEAAWYPKGYLFLVNPSFLLLDDRAKAFLDIYDLLYGKTLDTNVVHALLANVLPKKDWGKTAQDNELLKLWFEYPTTRYDTSKAWKFMSFLRHVNRHPFDYFNTSFGQFSKAELQMLLQTKFPMVMSKLYLNLWTERLLKGLEPHRFYRVH